jgi:hypothetical protein
MSFRPTDRDPPAPPVTWHKARLIDGSRSFLYRDRYGVMQHAGPGDEVVIDGDTLQVRRRDCKLL